MKAILRSGFLALAIMALAVPASAGLFEDGLTAYQRGDYLKKRSTKSHSERQQRIKAHYNKAAICARKDRGDDEAGSVKGHVPNSGCA